MVGLAASKITQPAVATGCREPAHCVRGRARRGYLPSFRSFFLTALTAWLLAQAWPANCADEWVYTVRPGENLWLLTERYLNDHEHVLELQRLNRIADPRRIPPGTQLRMPWAWTRASPGSARFAAVVGTVRVSSTGPQGGERPATLELVLHAGDIIKTEPHANAVLAFADGSHLTLLSESILRLDKLLDYSNGTSAAWLDLQQGRTESQVPSGGNSRSRFHINTPAGVTSVRGTQLRVSVPAQEAVSRTEVLAGGVYVANAGKEIIVNAGYGTLVRAGEAPASPVALLPPPDLTGLPGTVSRLPIELGFAPVPGALAYRVQVATSAEFDRIVFESLNRTPKTTLPVLPNARYVLRARAIDTLGIEGHNAERPIELAARPEAPIALQPADGEIVGTGTPTFRWTASDNAQSYHFQISPDAAFSELGADMPDLREPSIALRQPLASGVYFWRVAAVHAEQGAGPFGSAHAFRIAPPAPAVAAASLTPIHIRVRWESDRPGRRYRVGLARDLEFQRVVSDTEVDEPALQLARPAPGRYYLRVRAVEPDGYEGPYETPQTIELHAPPAPPRALHPLDNASIAEEAPQFRWQPISGAERYRFQLARNRAFEAPLLVVATVTQPSFTLARSIEPGVYFWRVAAGNNVDGEGEYGPPQSLRRVPPAPEYGPADADAFTLLLRWQASEAASQYDVELAADAAFNDVLTRARVGEPQLRIPRPAGGRYFMRVRAVDTDGVPGSYGLAQPVEVRARPAPPQLLDPAPGAHVPEKVQLHWSEQESSARYHIQLSTDQQFNATLLDQRRVEGTALILPSMLPPGVYYWRVAASTEADGEGRFSQAQSFRVLPQPPALTAVDATGGQVIFRWREEPHSAQYQVQLAKDAQFHTVVIDQRARAGVLQAARPVGGNYFVRIRSIDAEGNPGLYSTPRSVQVPARFPYWLLPLLPFIIFPL